MNVSTRFKKKLKKKKKNLRKSGDTDEVLALLESHAARRLSTDKGKKHQKSERDNQLEHEHTPRKKTRKQQKQKETNKKTDMQTRSWRSSSVMLPAGSSVPSSHTISTPSVEIVANCRVTWSNALRGRTTHSISTSLLRLVLQQYGGWR